MAMTPRDRTLAVFRRETPDVVPCMLDLSHWFYQRRGLPWDLTAVFTEPEYALIDYHKLAGVGFYMPNLAAFFSASYGPSVKAETRKAMKGGVTEITWRLETPRGAIERKRIWEPDSYSWAISEWGVRTETDLKVLAEALGSRTYEGRWENYLAWRDYVGDLGVVYIPAGYSAVGHLLHYWMGVEGTLFAAADWPAAFGGAVERINDNTLRLIDLLAASPAEIICLGDNFSGDVQPPSFFNVWSRPYYVEAVRRLHAAGKHVVVHIDGRLRGALGMIRDTGADGCDAATPGQPGDLSAAACRDEAGPGFLLSGGVPPQLWLPEAPLESFRRAALDWLELKRSGPRLILNAGDQVPPGAEESRIGLLRDLAEEYGRFL